MATTTNYAFVLPTVGVDDAAWGGFLNQNWTDLDADLTAMQADIDSRILTSGIGSVVQAFDATIMVDADIGVTVQAWDAQLDSLATVSAANATAVGNLTGINSGDEAAATTTAQGIVEKSTSAENIAGVAVDKFPDVAGAKEIVDTFNPVKAWGVFDGDGAVPAIINPSSLVNWILSPLSARSPPSPVKTCSHSILPLACLIVCNSVVIVSISSTCSLTNHCRKLLLVKSFTSTAMRTRLLIWLVTVIS